MYEHKQRPLHFQTVETITIVYGDYKSKSADYNPDITICSGTYKFTNGAGNNHPLKILGLPDNTYTVITTQYKNIVLTPGNYDYICTLQQPPITINI